MDFRRAHFRALDQRLTEPPRLIQILAGPRQVGKSTLVRQVLEERPVQAVRFEDAQAVVHASDEEARNWLVAKWRQAAQAAADWRSSSLGVASGLPFTLAIDEVQSVPQWSTVVKALWDAERARSGMHLVLLGSAPLLVQQGLNESLTGRYELQTLPHWSFAEMRDCFGTTLDEHLYFGSYPGSARLFSDELRWRDYVRFSLVEPSIERDVLAMERVDAPALMRRLFELGCDFSAQILAMTKVSQTLGAGHVQTLNHYLTLLRHAGLLTGLQKHAANTLRQRQSPPKFQVLNNALMNALGRHTFEQAKADRSRWGRLVESAVGSHLLNTADSSTRIHYWRDGALEVDFVVEGPAGTVAIEVKSGFAEPRPPGLQEFLRRNPGARQLVVGGEEVPLHEFLLRSAKEWLAG